MPARTNESSCIVAQGGIALLTALAFAWSTLIVFWVHSEFGDAREYA